MMDGSLMDAIHTLPPHQVGVLIIDEQLGFTDTSSLIERQQRLILAANWHGCRFWFVENDPGGTGNPSPTLLRLRAVVGGQRVQRISKERFNGFDGTDLDYRLGLAGIHYLVLVGHMSNCCVKHTAVGGQRGRRGPFVDGATGLGYQVLSSDEVLSGDPADWTDEPGVMFYRAM